MRADVVVRDAGAKGKGVYTLRDFAAGDFIFRRRHGRVIPYSAVDSLPEAEREHICELDWETCAVLLAPGCYLNHACEPNAMRHGVNVYAWRAMHADDKITIDYRLNAFGDDVWACTCGSANCTGSVVGSFFAMDAKRQRTFLPYAPRFIQREYRRLQAERNGK